MSFDELAEFRIIPEGESLFTIQQKSLDFAGRTIWRLYKSGLVSVSAAEQEIQSAIAAIFEKRRQNKAIAERKEVFTPLYYDENSFNNPR